MSKRIVFDMDGTIADFYGVENWLECLKNSDTTPYEMAKPLYDINELNNILYQLKAKGSVIVITSWLSKGGSKEFNNATRKAKREWKSAFERTIKTVHAVARGHGASACGYEYLDLPDRSSRWIPDVRICPDLYYDGGHSVSV